MVKLQFQTLVSHWLRNLQSVYFTSSAQVTNLKSNEL